MYLLLRLLATWVVYTLLFVVAKPLFMLLNAGSYSWASASDYLDVMAHGLRLDMAVGAYLTIFPALVSLVSVWWKGRVTFYAYRAWFILSSLLIAGITVLNSVLYSFWHFPLDMTPVFYFMTSPSAAAASVSWLFILVGIGVTLIIAAGIYFILRLLYHIPFRRADTARGRWLTAGGVVLFLGLLFIPIRGGFSVATLNLSSAYFSERQPLNHAAINPAFSLLYSATHQNDFRRLGHYFDDATAESLFDGLKAHEHASGLADAASRMPELLSVERPDIYVIILESFSNRLFPSLGGDTIAVGLDSIAGKGLLFTNFYANGFRTDRGIPAILSGMPSPPATSIMKLSDKLDRWPSVGSSLRREGYETTYYYGGDANFTNMRAYLVSAGFSRIISDRDFPMGERLSKWGVHDGPLFERVIADTELASDEAGAPRLTVIQTSSSHEPFEVPARFARHAGEPAPVNAFAYTDSVVTRFINTLAASASWPRTLVVLVADHWGAYPEARPDDDTRHRVPLIVTGGALMAAPQRIDTYASQADLAPTLMSWMHLPASSSFRYGNVITDPDVPHFGIWMDSDRMGMVMDGGRQAVLNTDTNRPVTVSGDSMMVNRMRAYLQTLYNDLSK